MWALGLGSEARGEQPDGAGDAPHSQVLGEPRAVCPFSLQNTRAQVAWTPGTGGHPWRHPPMVEGGSDLGEPARCRPQPLAELTQPWRLTGGDRPRAGCPARPGPWCPVSPPQVLPGPGLGAADTDVGACL